jgi:nucleoside-diphosphate-sugar epimerase
VNVGMLRGVLDGLRDAGAPLRHVTLYQGGKAYGAHLRVYRTPARETDPRLPIPHFYYGQEDLLRERSATEDWTFTVLRPDIVLGTSVGSPMNLAQTLAAYALITRELGLPLRYPGTLGATALVNCTDAGLLAEATHWAGTTEAAAGGTFNVVNGDLFRWPQLFARVADYFGMETLDPQPLTLAENMPALAPVWERLAEREGLAQPDVTRVAGWEFVDFLWSTEEDGVLDPLALRAAGFDGFRRTEDALVAVLDRLREAVRRRRLAPGSPQPVGPVERTTRSASPHASSAVGAATRTPQPGPFSDALRGTSTHWALAHSGMEAMRASLKR